eukprot:5280440-Amphidinium_carterae.3
MPMEGLVWTTLLGRELLQDVMHPDALPHYQHPEGRPHALMFPLFVAANFDDGRNIRGSMYGDHNTETGTVEFLEFLEAFTSHMKKMLGVLKESMFNQYGLNTKDSSLKRFRAPNHPVGNVLDCEFGKGWDSEDLCSPFDGQHVHQSGNRMQGGVVRHKPLIFPWSDCCPCSDAESRRNCGDHVSHCSARGVVA